MRLVLLFLALVLFGCTENVDVYEEGTWRPLVVPGDEVTPMLSPSTPQFIRWGDQQQLAVKSGVTGNFTSQLVKAALLAPETWTITLSLDVNQPGLPGGFDAICTWSVIIGAGSSTATLTPFINLNGAVLNDIFTPNYILTSNENAWLSFEVVAQEIQIQAQVQTTFNGVVKIGAFAAPRFNPYASSVPDAVGGDSGDGRHTEYMPPGFNEIPTRYR
jgi:hypothetical protein